MLKFVKFILRRNPLCYACTPHAEYISNAVKKFIFDNKLQKTILNKTVTFQDYTIIKLFT